MAFGTLTEHIYNEIRQAIISGEFEGGERLKEVALAKHFNSSQTPVREALARLAQEGFIQIDRYRGATVSSYTATDFDNLYDIRMFLELPAIRMAAEKITDKQLKTLKIILKHGESALLAGDQWQCEHLDLDFHETITDCSGNPYLAKMTRSNHEKIQSIRRVAIAATQYGEKSHTEHTLIIDSIASRDPNRAECALRDHILRNKDEVLKYLSN